jgi:predicted GIY-YIG superfamily endonuclease
MFLGENEYNQTSKEKINQIKTKLYTEGYAIKGLEQSIGFFEKGKAISEKINLKEFTKKADYGIIKSKENIKIIKGYLDESK